MSQCTAIVHDRLYHMGGAEAVLRDLIRQHQSDHPNHQVSIFTMFSDKKFLMINNQKLHIITALPRWIFTIFRYFELHRIRLLSKLFDYRNLMFFYPILVKILRRKVRLYQPDCLIVSSFAAVKNIVPIYEDNILARPLATTVYLHSPIQYIWDYYDENLAKLNFPIKQLYQIITPVLRRWDQLPRHYDTIVANSHYTAHGAQKLYGRQCEVRYPCLHPAYQGAEVVQQSDYYVFVGRLVRFAKELEIIIQLFNYTQDKLMIIGSGPDEEYLKSIAGANIEFRGQINIIHDKMNLVGPARGLINLTRESFGMVTLEALCQGVPVFGYRQGGSVELVDEHSGLLTQHKSLLVLIEKFTQFQTIDRDRQSIAQRAQQLLRRS